MYFERFKNFYNKFKYRYNSYTDYYNNLINKQTVFIKDLNKYMILNKSPDDKNNLNLHVMTKFAGDNFYEHFKTIFESKEIIFFDFINFFIEDRINIYPVSSFHTIYEYDKYRKKIMKSDSSMLKSGKYNTVILSKTSNEHEYFKIEKVIGKKQYVAINLNFFLAFIVNHYLNTSCISDECICLSVTFLLEKITKAFVLSLGNSYTFQFYFNKNLLNHFDKISQTQLLEETDMKLNSTFEIFVEVLIKNIKSLLQVIAADQFFCYLTYVEDIIKTCAEHQVKLKNHKNINHYANL